MRKSREDGLLSQKYIIEALNLLLSEHPFEEITVTDICKKAGVARVTFYKYYQSVYEVMTATVQLKIQKFIEQTSSNGSIGLEETLKFAMDELVPSKKALKNLIQSKTAMILLDYFNYAIEAISKADKCSPPLSRNQILFYAGGAFNIILDWVNTDSQNSTQELTDSLFDTLSFLLKKNN